MLNTTELKDRVEARRLELKAKLLKLKAETHHDAVAARDKIQHALGEVEETIKDGWDKVTDGAKAKLQEWLDRVN